MLKRSRLSPVLLASCLAAAGCNTPPDTTVGDSGVDGAAPDAPLGHDAGHDGGSVVTADAGMDGGTILGGDAGMDGGTIVGGDAGTDAAANPDAAVGSDVGTDGAVTTADAGSDGGTTTGSACAAAVHTLDCSSGTVMGDTSTGTMAIGGYDCTSNNYAGREVVYRFTNPANAIVTITSTRLSSTTGDYDLYVLDGGDGSIDCTSSSTCTDYSDAADGTMVNAHETVTFNIAPGDVQWVSYDLYASGTTPTTDTTTFSLAVTCVIPVCGNGTVEGTETCDDGNTAPGDGCSATCTQETGYGCSGSPSVCQLLPTFTTITAACVDVSSATPLSIMGIDDAVSDPAALPFPFTFFGVAQAFYSVSSNGNLQLFPDATGTGDDAWTNESIPNTDTPNNYIAPYWDDLMNGVQQILVTGSAGSRRMVVQWQGGDPADLTFQAILYEGTNVIEFHYCDISDGNNGSSATIGIENADGTIGTQIAYDTDASATTGSGYRLTP